MTLDEERIELKKYEDKQENDLRLASKAAEKLAANLIHESQQIQNMRNYCREMYKQLPCDALPEWSPSKELRVRYGLRYEDNNIMWVILEKYFKEKIESAK